MTDFDHPLNPFPANGVRPLHTTAGRRPANAVWNAEAADRAVAFIEGLRHTVGPLAGELFLLSPEQKWLVREAFGWYVPSPRGGMRRLYRYVYVEMGRGNGKSQLGAGIAGVLLFADGEAKPDVSGAAADRDQAKIILTRLKDAVRTNPDLLKRSDVQTTLVRHKRNGGEYKARSADVRGSWGGVPHGIVFDEIHAQPNRELYSALTTAMLKREQPMCWEFTTAGYDRESLCWERHQLVVDVAAGSRSAPDTLGAIWAAPEDADWTDPAVWQLANPMLSTPGTDRTPSGHPAALLHDDMAAECQKALDNPVAQNAFRMLYLSQWVGQAVRYIPMHAWDACDGAPAAPAKRPAFGGLDLASTTDLAALGVVALGPDEVVDTYLWLFAPEDGLRERSLRDRVPYDVWAREGYLTLTPGAVIDQTYIRAAVMQAAAQFDLKDVGYDRWNASQLVIELKQEGIEMVEVGQGYASMSAPTKEVLRLALEHKFRHGGNPALRWMVDNTAATIDPAGNVKPDKAKSNGRIDGVVSVVMAVDGLTRRGRVAPRVSAYEIDD